MSRITRRSCAQARLCLDVCGRRDAARYAVTRPSHSALKGRGCKMSLFLTILRAYLLLKRPYWVRCCLSCELATGFVHLWERRQACSERAQPHRSQAHACTVLLWSQYTKQAHLLTDGHKETSKTQRAPACESRCAVCGQRRFRGSLLTTSEAVCGSGLLNGYQEEAEAFAAKACNVV